MLSARFVLAYKSIPYETVWLEHADIEPALKSMSAFFPTSLLTSTIA